ncbi:mobilization protein [Helicobacter felis]|uniref:mobilization protein n=1 Tax=Helicobacter felis TaxID=214 RepID=UPI001F3ED745|nr:mobilization protein [Helicobacter felis]
MGNIASINFKPTKLSIQEKHNDRSVMPSYVLKSGGLGIECNRNAQEARALRNGMIEKAKEDYKHCFNQPFKAKSYLWSAVVNLKPDSTMQDLERLTERLKERYGFQCYQIAIHRDEGHVDDEGKEHINHHAHLEFVTLHESTGKSMFRKGLITREVMSEIQTLTALVLQMKRGEYKNDRIDEQGNLIKGTGRKRIEPRAYG